jgi:hypothetical protein
MAGTQCASAATQLSVQQHCGIINMNDHYLEDSEEI